MCCIFVNLQSFCSCRVLSNLSRKDVNNAVNSMVLERTKICAAPSNPMHSPQSITESTSSRLRKLEIGKDSIQDQDSFNLFPQESAKIFLPMFTTLSILSDPLLSSIRPSPRPPHPAPPIPSIVSFTASPPIPTIPMHACSHSCYLPRSLPSLVIGGIMFFIQNLNTPRMTQSRKSPGIQQAGRA